MKKSLPPYGSKFLEEQPAAGLWIAVGPRSWQIAQGKPFPVVVLPPGHRPGDYRWPATSAPALIFESGPRNDDLILEVATAIMLEGAPSVVAIRESMLREHTCCTFYEAVADDGR